MPYNKTLTNPLPKFINSLKPVISLSSALSLLHDQIAFDLDQARSVAHHAAHQLDHLQQRSRFNQQQIHQAQVRVDQLLARLQQPKPPANTQIGSFTEQESVADQKGLNRIEQLQQQIHQRSELLRQSAHDLHSNFSLIQGATYLLDQAPMEADRHHILGILQRNLTQATHLLTQLLDMSRLEAGEERRQLTTFNIVGLLGDLVETVRPLADKKGLWVRKQGIKSLLIEGDEVKLYRVAQNLLLNAIKYTQRGGVTLGWAIGVARQEWLLTVTDTGPGLSVGRQQALGEGVGLVIVRGLCALLEGRFLVEEPPGGGTRFVLWFPQRYAD